MEPVEPGAEVFCRIVRKRESFKRKMFPKFFVYLECADGQVIFIMAAKKRTKNKTSNYSISTDPNYYRKDNISFLGKLRSNFQGTEFLILDNGLNPLRKNNNTTTISSSSSSNTIPRRASTDAVAGLLMADEDDEKQAQNADKENIPAPAPRAYISPSKKRKATKLKYQAGKALSPDKTLCIPFNQEPRKQLGCVFYRPQELGNPLPRLMHVGLPGFFCGKFSALQPATRTDLTLTRAYAAKLSNQGVQVHSPSGKKSKAVSPAASPEKQREEQKVAERLWSFCSKPPDWNTEQNRYELVYQRPERVCCPSVKNFQLVTNHTPPSELQQVFSTSASSAEVRDEQGQADRKVLLQMGKMSKDTFSMDFTYPFSPYQAVCVCLSSIDNKLACE
mmetsp:Transcript_9502/g.18006  ORF Transcript_9502/g.18006 Transcript_9502/m.18006 type:complete len:391 (-) Transcript_9502:49-1221(-)